MESEPRAIARSIQSLLADAADQRTRDWWERYMKGTARFRGVPMAGIRSAVQTTWTAELASRPLTRSLAVVDALFASEMSEDKLAGVLLLTEHLSDRLEAKHATALARPFVRGEIADWGVCDWYSTKALHAFLVAQPQEIADRSRRIAAWSREPRLWQRRAAVVAFVQLAAKPEPFAGFTDLVLDACAANLISDDRFAHTGPGWVLRELSRVSPARVKAFVEDHPELSKEAQRMATARLRPGPYRRR